MSAFGGASVDADDWEQCDVARITPPKPTDARAVPGNDDSMASSFQRLHLVAPPLAQDGGRFDAAEPFARLSRQQSPHALFDPNASYPQPVSPATATAAVARFGPLDPVLLAGLENPRERLSLLKFEDQIVRFLRHPRESQLRFPPLSSYHRLIIHRLADRCCLEHQTADSHASFGYDGNASRVVTLFKTPQTIIPRVLLIDLSADKQQPAVTPALAPKIMVRKRVQARGNGVNGGRGDGEQTPQQRTIEDRERAYAEARARIFGEDASSSTAESSSTGSTDDGQATRNQNTTNGNGPRLGGGGVQAVGPDGTKGFARGGGGGGSGRGNGTTGTSITGTQRAELDTTSRANNALAEHRSNAPVAATATAKPQQNWKESKVLWRNREQELNDPDFTRNHNAYRPSRDRDTNRNTNNNGGAGHQSFHYDGARSFGYGGRGRGEYARIDSAPRQAQPPPPPPPPPSDFFRQPGPIQAPPPPPPGGYSTAYSPRTRGGGGGGGGYGGVPQPPPSSQQAVRRGTTPNLPHGGYNEEFPPLGK